LVDPYVVTDNAAMVKHDAEPIMAKVYVLSSDLRLVWNEAAKPKTQELLNRERQYWNSPAVESIRRSVYVIRKIRFGDKLFGPFAARACALTGRGSLHQTKPRRKELFEPGHLFSAAERRKFR
jgi:hypothetical protein